MRGRGAIAGAGLTLALGLVCAWLPATPALLQLAAQRASKACARNRQAEEALAAAAGG